MNGHDHDMIKKLGRWHIRYFYMFISISTDGLSGLPSSASLKIYYLFLFFIFFTTTRIKLHGRCPASSEVHLDSVLLMGERRLIPVVEFATLISYRMGGQSSDEVGSAAGPNLAYLFPINDFSLDSARG
jgi:hypothetical protein